RESQAEQGRADDLVDRVVAPDVLAKHVERAVEREEPGGVQPSRRGEDLLASEQAPGQRGESRGVDARPAVLGRPRAGRQGLDARLAARSARGAREHRAPQPLPARRETSTQIARHDVALVEVLGIAADGDRADVLRPRDDALREEEPRGELLVVAGRPHRDAEGASVDPDLERLLDGDEVRARSPAPAPNTPLRAGDSPRRGAALPAAHAHDADLPFAAGDEPRPRSRASLHRPKSTAKADSGYDRRLSAGSPRCEWTIHGMDLGIRGRTALVTGPSRGVGP